MLPGNQRILLHKIKVKHLIDLKIKFKDKLKFEIVKILIKKTKKNSNVY